MKLGLKSLLTIVFLATVATLATGCTKPSLVAPPGFATLGSTDDYAYRATSAQGVVIGARVEKNEPAANADFWSHAVALRLEREGYVLESDQPAKSQNGIVGKQLRYTRNAAGRTYRYWVTLFVTEQRVYVVEAAGDKEEFDASASAIERALLSIKAS